jgi:hypothetical protein
MNAAELKQRLLEEGCSPHNFSIGHGGSDVYCLAQQEGIWWDFSSQTRKPAIWRHNWRKMGSCPIGTKSPMVAGAIRGIASS